MRNQEEQNIITEELKELEEENKAFRKRNIELRAEIARLESLVTHLEEELQNSKAGRKKHNPAWTERMQQVQDLKEQGLTKKTIMARLKISESTYLRFMREIKKERAAQEH